MFIEHFQESFPKLIMMRNREKKEELEKRLKEVNKLITKKRKKLEIDHSPQVDTQNNNIAANDKISMEQLGSQPLNINTDPRKSAEEIKSIEKSDSAKRMSSQQKALPVKPKGGDPHGAVQRMQEKELAEARKKIESQNNEKVNT